MPPHHASTWTKRVHGLTVEAKLSPPADEVRIAAIGQILGVTLPPALREFLRESDGLTDDFGTGVIWPVADIERINREFRMNKDFREIYMPFDNLLFFGEDGGGDQFAFAIQADGGIHRQDIYRWEHESDARSWFAAHLEQFLERRLKPMDD